jgi:hypothetical protein
MVNPPGPMGTLLMVLSLNQYKGRRTNTRERTLSIGLGSASHSCLFLLKKRNESKPGYLSLYKYTPRSPVALFQSTHPPTANWFVFRGLMKMLFSPTAVLEPWKAVRFCPPSRRPHLNMRVCESSLRSNCRRMDRGHFLKCLTALRRTREI